MKKSLSKLSNVTTQSFLDKVKERYIEKYADDVVVLLDDQKKLQKALEKVTKYVERIEAGEIEAIEEYKTARKRLEVEEDASLH